MLVEVGDDGLDEQWRAFLDRCLDDPAIAEVWLGALALGVTFDGLFEVAGLP